MNIPYFCLKVSSKTAQATLSKETIMFYDLLVHVDLPDESRFVMALGNISNYLAALNGEPCTVVLLANGGAARFFAR